MRLRQLFESTASSVGIIFGRFNPPHQGHRAAWEMAAQNDHWFVGTNKSTQGPKDPLPYDVKVKAMLAVWPELKGHIVPETSWLTLASQVYKKFGNVQLNVYTDEDWVTKTLVQYNGKEGPHGLYNFPSIKQHPTPRLSSATALRAAVQAGDRQAFEKAAGVPADTDVAGHPYFDLVAHFLGATAQPAKPVKKHKKEKDVAETDEHDDPTRDKELYNLQADLWDLYKDVTGFRPRPGNVDWTPEQWKDKDFLRSKINHYVKFLDSDLDEEAAGVGIITKQNTTVDVNKNTPKKNLKAFRLA